MVILIISVIATLPDNQIGMCCPEEVFGSESTCDGSGCDENCCNCITCGLADQEEGDHSAHMIMNGKILFYIPYFLDFT